MLPLWTQVPRHHLACSVSELRTTRFRRAQLRPLLRERVSCEAEVGVPGRSCGPVRHTTADPCCTDPRDRPNPNKK